MALLNGQTPEELASEIMNDAIEDAVLEIDGVTSQDLDVIAKYSFRDKIQVRGEKYWNTNRDDFRKTVITKLIQDKAETLRKYMDKREKDAAMEYFLLLRAKGMSLEQAAKESGIEA